MGPIIVDDKLPGADAGITPPTRNEASGGSSLRISNLDHADPTATATVLASAATDIGTEGHEGILRSLAARHGLSEPMENLLPFHSEHGEPSTLRFWGIANFDLKSSEPRLFIFDVRTEQVRLYLCAHGKNSDAGNHGYAKVFSNAIGSQCTSLGVYACAELYTGKHGPSMRLDGLENTNSNARKRAVVVHGAKYVSPEYVKRYGRIGRSDGCFALEIRYVGEVIAALTGGSLILAWHRGGRGGT
jgi:hypothetical protein